MRGFPQSWKFDASTLLPKCSSCLITRPRTWQPRSNFPIIDLWSTLQLFINRSCSTISIRVTSATSFHVILRNSSWVAHNLDTSFLLLMNFALVECMKYILPDTMPSGKFHGLYSEVAVVSWSHYQRPARSILCFFSNPLRND